MVDFGEEEGEREGQGREGCGGESGGEKLRREFGGLKITANPELKTSL